MNHSTPFSTPSTTQHHSYKNFQPEFHKFSLKNRNHQKIKQLPTFLSSKAKQSSRNSILASPFCTYRQAQSTLNSNSQQSFKSSNNLNNLKIQKHEIDLNQHERNNQQNMTQFKNPFKGDKYLTKDEQNLAQKFESKRLIREIYISKKNHLQFELQNHKQNGMGKNIQNSKGQTYHDSFSRVQKNYNPASQNNKIESNYQMMENNHNKSFNNTDLQHNSNDLRHKTLALHKSGHLLQSNTSTNNFDLLQANNNSFKLNNIHNLSTQPMQPLLYHQNYENQNIKMENPYTTAHTTKNNPYAFLNTNKCSSKNITPGNPIKYLSPNTKYHIFSENQSNGMLGSAHPKIRQENLYYQHADQYKQIRNSRESEINSQSKLTKNEQNSHNNSKSNNDSKSNNNSYNKSKSNNNSNIYSKSHKKSEFRAEVEQKQTSCKLQQQKQEAQLRMRDGNEKLSSHEMEKTLQNEKIYSKKVSISSYINKKQHRNNASKNEIFMRLKYHDLIGKSIGNTSSISSAKSNTKNNNSSHDNSSHNSQGHLNMLNSINSTPFLTPQLLSNPEKSRNTNLNRNQSILEREHILHNSNNINWLQNIKLTKYFCNTTKPDETSSEGCRCEPKCFWIDKWLMLASYQKANHHPLEISEETFLSSNSMNHPYQMSASTSHVNGYQQAYQQTYQQTYQHAYQQNNDQNKLKKEVNHVTDVTSERSSHRRLPTEQHSSTTETLSCLINKNVLQIEKDIPRTQSHTLTFQNIKYQHMLNQVLLRYCTVLDLDVGYMQGMNILASVIIYHSRNVYESVTVLEYVMVALRYRDIYRSLSLQFCKKEAAFTVLQIKLYVYDLYNFLVRLFVILQVNLHEIDIQFFVVSWYFSMLGSFLPLEQMHLVVDKFVNKQFVGLTEIILTLFLYLKEELMAMDDSSQIMLMFSNQSLTNRCKNMPIHDIVCNSYNLNLTNHSLNLRDLALQPPTQSKYQYQQGKQHYQQNDQQQIQHKKQMQFGKQKKQLYGSIKTLYQ